MFCNWGVIVVILVNWCVVLVVIDLFDEWVVVFIDLIYVGFVFSVGLKGIGRILGVILVGVGGIVGIILYYDSFFFECIIKFGYFLIDFSGVVVGLVDVYFVFIVLGIDKGGIF